MKPDRSRLPKGRSGVALVATALSLALFAGGAYGAYVVSATLRSSHRGASAPRAPRIYAKPAAKTDLRWALFSFGGAGRAARYECSLDHSRLTSCSGRVVYGLARGVLRSSSAARNVLKRRCTRAQKGRRSACSRAHVVGFGRPLGYGRHIFGVRAVEGLRRSPLATYSWSILTRSELEALRLRGATGTTGSTGGGGGEVETAPSGTTGGKGSTGEGGSSAPIVRTKSFQISGAPEGTLYPGGPALSISLRILNPNPSPITIYSLSVAVASSPAGCSAAENLQIVQSDVSQTLPLAVPAASTVTLPAQGVSAPTIQFLNLPVNQDACQNATFPLTYSGSAK